MRLADQWNRVETDLPGEWQAVNLAVRPESAAELPRVAAVLGPAGAARRGERLLLTVRPAGGPSGPEGVRRLFRRLDEQRVWCELELLDVATADEAGAEAIARPAAPSLVAGWDAALAVLPADWSDLLCFLALDSSDLLPRAALLCAPINPTRDRERTGFVFRVARRAGYGVAPGMARRCLERCDAEGITGRVGVVRVLTGTDNVATQGPVWYVGGRVL